MKGWMRTLTFSASGAPPRSQQQAVMGAELTAGQGPAPLLASIMALSADEEVLSVSL